MAVGRILGLDYGTVRIGVAVSDGLGISARPVRSVPADQFEDLIEGLVEEFGPIGVVVGLPTSLAGEEGASAAGARELAELVEARTGLEVVLADERFSSTRAEAILKDRVRDRRERREQVDAVAAAVLLQGWLDARAGEERGNPRYAPKPD